jgi:hypothetical protein
MRPIYSLNVRQPPALQAKSLTRSIRNSDCLTSHPGHPLQTSNGSASCLETPLPPSSRNTQRSGCRSVFLCSIHTRQSFGPSSAPYYPHLPRSLKTSTPMRTFKPGKLHRWEFWGPRECTHAQTYIHTHTHTHTHTHMPNSTHWQRKHCTLHVTRCTTLFVRHFPYVTFHTSPSARQSLHITLCKSPSARHSLASRPLHVTPYTSLPTRRSLIAAPSPSLSVHRSRHGTLYTSFSTRHSLNATLCMPLPTCQSPHGTPCTSSWARHSLYVTPRKSLYVQAPAHAP